MRRHDDGTSRISEIREGVRIETQPIPIPLARAASHIIAIAPTTEYSAISGIVLRPRPWPASVALSQNTARWQGASSRPANFNAGIARSAFAAIGSQRLGIAGLEVGDDGLAPIN